MHYQKSPLNYIGGKYRLLNQLLPLFPSCIGTFVDLFAGGLDVSLNAKADAHICNDINYYIIAMYKKFQELPIEDILSYLDRRIAVMGLSKENAEAYLELRNEYNQNQNPLDLFLLICYGFNHQIRFNNSHEFNNPFGRNRSSFNERIRSNLIEFKTRISNFKFSSLNFKLFDFSPLQPSDFVYCDPPYLITTGPYNDGRRGFEGWASGDDQALFAILDSLNRRGIKFALSNVSQHKGRENLSLLQWAAAYRVINISSSYSNCNYQTADDGTETQEVLVVNY